MIKINFDKIEAKRKELWYNRKKFSHLCWIPYPTYLSYTNRWANPKNINKILVAVVKIFNEDRVNWDFVTSRIIKFKEEDFIY